MARDRSGTWILLAGGLLFAAWMAYALSLDGAPSVDGRNASPGLSEIAVVFPDAADWADFRLGIDACARRGILRVIDRTDDGVLVRAARGDAQLRFVRRSARGGVETRAVVERLMSGTNPPIAFVGSINTALTAELAVALRDAGDRGNHAPPLLVPWATSIHAEIPGRSGPVELLRIDAGRTFRFCLNNRRQAGLVVRCVAAGKSLASPARVEIVVDTTDPYSRDLAAAFRDALRTYSPRAEIFERTDVVASGGMDTTPTTEERAWAEAFWRADSSPGARCRWVVLPLQAEPAGRLIEALRTAAPPVPKSPTHILCGDGFSAAELGTLAGERPRPFSLWTPTTSTSDERDAQIPAEIVASLIHLTARGTPADLAAALARLELRADDPDAMGRSIAFDSQGERRGEDLGRVLAILPERDGLLYFAPDGRGGWSDPIPMPPPTVLAEP